MIDLSESPAVLAALRGYYIEDYEERAKWQRAAAELAAPGVGVEVLELARRKLHTGAGLLTALRLQQTKISELIARLEQSTVGV